mgnify:CR=1 FL=1
MWTTWNIAKREFKSNFTSPLAYVVICLSLALLGIFVGFFLLWLLWAIGIGTNTGAGRGAHSATDALSDPTGRERQLSR